MSIIVSSNVIRPDLELLSALKITMKEMPDTSHDGGEEDELLAKEIKGAEYTEKTLVLQKKDTASTQ